MTTFYLVRHADTGVRGYRAEKACWKFKTDLSAGWKPYAPGPEERLIAVSHGDPIKSAVIYYAGLHLDMFDRFDVDLAV